MSTTEIITKQEIRVTIPVEKILTALEGTEEICFPKGKPKATSLSLKGDTLTVIWEAPTDDSCPF